MMIISCGGAGVVGDFDKLDRLMEYLDPNRFIEYLDPPRMGVQSRFIMALSMSTGEPLGDLLKEPLADLLLAPSCGEILYDDTLW